MSEIVIVLDDARWVEACMDTPFGAPQGCRTPEEAARKPGCAVKSREVDPNPGWRKHYGRLVEFDEREDRVLVRGHDSLVSPRFVWVGTVADYLALWECD